MKTELEKKKKIFGIATGAVFLIWVLVEMWLRLLDWEPLWDRIEWMVDEGLMSKKTVFTAFLNHIGKTNAVFYVVMGISSLVIMALAIGDSKRERLNVFAVTAVFTIFATDAARVIMALKNILSAPITAGTGISIWKMMYILGGGCATAIWFFAFVMAVVATTGNSIFKKLWYAPGVLYLLWAGIYFFGVPACVAYRNEYITFRDAVSVNDITHIFLGGGIILLGYWMSLFMPERKKLNKKENMVDNAWVAETPEESVASSVMQGVNQGAYNQTSADSVKTSNQNSMKSKQNSMR